MILAAIIGLGIFSFAAPCLAYKYAGGDVSTTESNQVGGAQAYIGTGRYPVVYGSSFSCAWAWLGRSDNYLKYMQVGWLKYPSAFKANNVPNPNLPHYFFQYCCGGNWYTTVNQNSPAELSSHTYQLFLEGDYQYGTWKVTWDGNLIDSLPTSRLNWKIPTYIGYMGEIYDDNAQCPGSTTNNKVQFLNVFYYSRSTGSWKRPSLNTWWSQSPCTLDNSSWSNFGYFHIWDNRY